MARTTMSSLTFEEFTNEFWLSPPPHLAEAFPNKFKYFDGLLRIDASSSDLDRPSVNLSTHAPLRNDLHQVLKLPKGHIAYNAGAGYGLFAKEAIEKGTVLGEYGGLVLENRRLPEDEWHPIYYALKDLTRGLYKRSEVMYTVEDENYAVNASYWGNEMRFINHYEGISKNFNVMIWPEAGADRLEYSAVIATKHIYPGAHVAEEEVVLDYGPGYCERYGIGSWFNTS